MSPPPATRGERQLKCAHVLSLLAFTLYFFATFARPFVFSGAVPGDPGDARFNMYILEHTYQWLSGRSVDLLSPPFFYPYPYAIFFSDTHAGTSFIYALFRSFGASEYTSFSLWTISGYLTTFWASYYVFYKLKFNPYVAGIAAAIVAFNLPSLMQLGHAQLSFRFGIPLSVFFAWSALARAHAPSGLAALCWFLAQILASIYLGVFLALFLLAFVVVFLVIARFNPHLVPPDPLRCLMQSVEHARTRTAILSALALVLGAAVAALLAGHAWVANLYQIRREWLEVEAMLPRPSSYLLMDGLAYWSALFPPDFFSGPMKHEHNIFFGLPVLMLFAAGVYCVFSCREETQQGLLARIALIAAFLVIAATVNIQGWSIYGIIYQLPGLNAIRAVTRISLMLAMPFALVGAYGLARMMTPSSAGGAKLCAAGLSVLVLAEIGAIELPSYSAQADAARVDRLVALARQKKLTQENPILGVLGFYDQSITVVNLDGMLAGQKLGWPTFNGYSGALPASPYVLPACETPLEVYSQYLDWRSLRSRDDGHSLDELMSRTKLIGPTDCPGLSQQAWKQHVATRGVPPPESVAAQIELSALSLEIKKGYLAASLKIENHSSFYISKWSAGPIRFSWRFVKVGAGNETQPFDGRQSIASDLPAASSSTSTILAPLPSEPGSYMFQVTVVSENRFWLQDRGTKILTFSKPVDVQRN